MTDDLLDCLIIPIKSFSQGFDYVKFPPKSFQLREYHGEKGFGDLGLVTAMTALTSQNRNVGTVTVQCLFT